MRYIHFLLLGLLITSCKQDKDVALRATEIIDKSIEVSGGEKFNHSTIDFDFRDKHYHASRNNGEFKLVRTFKNSVRKVTDFLTNEGFERLVNNKKTVVPDSMIVRYSNSVNSVHYFSVLPYGLNDSAVIKELIDEVTIKSKTYYKIKVTFNEEGGGEDFEDVFVYWIHKETFKVDYLAYSYQDPGELGLRFREAYNERYVNGLRFVDYNNYKPKDSDVSLLELDSLFEKENLKLLSKIELKNITVD